jgi:hypothetical protein
MDEMTASTGIDVWGDEPGFADESSVLAEHFDVDEPASESAWSGPTQEEWDTVTDWLQQQQEAQTAWEQEQAADYEFQQAAEWDEAIREYLDPYSALYDPTAAQAMIAELAQQHVSPLIELINAAQQEQAAEALTDAIHDGFEASGIPEDRFEQAEGRANEVFEQMIRASEHDPAWAAAWQQVVATGDQSQIENFLADRDQRFAVRALEHTAEEWTRAQEVAGARDEMELLHLRTTPTQPKEPRSGRYERLLAQV